MKETQKTWSLDKILHYRLFHHFRANQICQLNVPDPIVFRKDTWMSQEVSKRLLSGLYP